MSDAMEARKIQALAEARRTLPDDARLEAHYVENEDRVQVFLFKTVVETVTTPATELSLLEARTIDPEISLGEELGFDVRDLHITLPGG